MRIILLFLVFGICTPLSGQFNISVGYSLGYTPAQAINDMVYEFNGVFRDSMYLGNEMEELHYLHGVTVGLRWKLERFAFELNWEKLNRNREALGENDLDQLFQKSINYSINNYSASLESQLGNFGLGLAAGLRNFQIREEIANSGENRTFLKDNQYFIKPFISLNLLGGDRGSLSLKPYISIPFNTIGLGPLADEFEIAGSDQTEKLWMGGITVVFYNGQQ